jgi:hypothetical protein
VVESLAQFAVQAAHDASFRASMRAGSHDRDRLCLVACLPGELLDRGLQDVGAAAHLPVTGLRNASADCWSLTLEQLAPRMVELDLVSQDTLDRTQDLLADPRFSDLGHGMLSVQARRAAPGQ